MEGYPQVRLLEVDALDRLDLTRALPEGSFEVEKKRRRTGTEHGDLGIAAALLIVLGPPVIKALSTW